MKKIALFSALFALVSLAANAQLTFDGGITAKDIKTTSTADSVRVDMTLEIADAAANRHQGVGIFPVLSDGDNSVQFPYVLVNGRNHDKVYRRMVKFKNTELMEHLPQQVIVLARKNNGDKEVNYSGSVAREDWMANAVLNLKFGLSAYAGERQYYTAAVSGTAHTPAPPAPVKAPAVVPPVTAPVVTEPVTEHKPTPVIKADPLPEPEPEKIPAVIVVREPQPAPKPQPATEPVSVAPGKHSVTGTSQIDFALNSSQLLTAYKGNAGEIAKIERIMDEISRYSTARITRLEIVGYASPEGPYSDNVQLAQGRANALMTYLRGKYNISIDNSQVNFIPEDWQGLKREVRNSSLPYRAEVIKVIDGSDSSDTKETKLRRMMGGQIWQTMFRDMFPPLRRVEYKIDYEVSD